LSGEAINQGADGREYDIGQEPLGRGYNGMPLILTHAEESPFLRAWNEAEDLGEKLGGRFLRVRNFGEKGAKIG
jgi:hypothetical protein